MARIWIQNVAFRLFWPFGYILAFCTSWSFGPYWLFGPFWPLVPLAFGLMDPSWPFVPPLVFLSLLFSEKLDDCNHRTNSLHSCVHQKCWCTYRLFGLTAYRYVCKFFGCRQTSFVATFTYYLFRSSHTYSGLFSSCHVGFEKSTASLNKRSTFFCGLL